MSVRFCSTSAIDVLANYFECRDLLLDALAHGDGRVTEALLVHQLVTGEYQLWRTDNSAGVTQINENPFNKCLFIFLAAGDLNEIANVAGPVIEQWAADIGCTSIILSGRLGWERAVRPLGYEFQSTNLIKKL